MLILVTLYCKSAHSPHSAILNFGRAKGLHLHNLRTLEASFQLEVRLQVPSAS